MLAEGRKKQVLVVLNVVAALSVIALAAKLVFAPLIVVGYWGDRYKELVFQCDNVMRDHLIAKNRVAHDASDMAVQQLRAAEVGLLSCHDYDRLRKRMLIWGVSEAKLADLGLEVIEASARDVREFVRTHEIRY
jgi:hypothetical protein